MAINSALELDKTRSRILHEQLTIWLNRKQLKKEQESTIKAEACVRFPKAEKPSSSDVHETQAYYNHQEEEPHSAYGSKIIVQSLIDKIQWLKLS